MRKIAEQLHGSRVGKKVVFCSGTFDLLHKGHVEFLKRAKEQGDILVVAVNSDQDVSRRKGPGRPVICQEDIAHVISALSSVDFVFIEYTRIHKEEIISTLHPDVIMMNNDHYKSKEHLKRCELLKAMFPEITFVNSAIRDGEISTTHIIEKIKNLK
jgi:rfaE bifunctional protein nucleotidyltransferase chain/domain